MREYKFRAYNNRLSIMSDYITAIQNGDTQGTPSSVNVIVNGKNETWDIEHDHVVLEQFTGLKDKNGKEIYENDLVKNKYGKILKVEFNYGSFTFGDYYFGSIGFGKPFEVVGDIHNNPDLAEVSE